MHFHQFHLHTAKRFLKTIISLFLCFCLCACGSSVEESEYKHTAFSGGVWITYLELNEMLESEKGFEKSFKQVLDNCEKLGISDIYLHTRAFCDSIFASEFFPIIKSAKKFNRDILSYITEQCHERQIRIHAWINPYRISNSTNDISSIEENCPAYIWLNDDNEENNRFVSFTENGIYLNPAESGVRNLVIKGIREILLNYKVDGIHFDDYFYPTKEESFDRASYNEYKKDNASPLSLDDWRRANVNALISGCYTAIKFIDKDIIFSISPAADIDKNYNDLYADVTVWIKNGCVDYIMPQIYFGFEYPADEYKFENLLKQWRNLSLDNGNTPLVIGLAAYKIGSTDKNDIEWSERSDILARQVDLCKKSEGVLGHCFFSYSSLFSQNAEKELTNLLKEKSNEQ